MDIAVRRFVVPVQNAKYKDGRWHTKL